MADVMTRAWLLEVDAVVVLGLLVLALGVLARFLVLFASHGFTVGPAVLDLLLELTRLRVALWFPVYALQKVYPLSLTCQIPWFSSLSSIYSFVFGWKRDGVFVEVGAFDGESFSNTSGLADLGWEGHYIEPVPQYAKQCEQRHQSAVSQGRVHVHRYAVSDEASAGQEIEISAAGPFSSAMDDEQEAFASMPGASLLAALGWAHDDKKPKVKATTKDLNSILQHDCNIAPLTTSTTTTTSTSTTPTSTTRSSTPTRRGRKKKGEGEGEGGKGEGGKGEGAGEVWARDFLEERDAGKIGFNIDVMVVDIEGLEWPVLRDLDWNRFRPKMVIVEIQEKLKRYSSSPRALAEAKAIEQLLQDNNYSILYRDVVNTIFLHRAVQCHGEN